MLKGLSRTGGWAVSNEQTVVQLAPIRQTCEDGVVSERSAALGSPFLYRRVQE